MSVTALLDRPIPLLGLRSQRLGSVCRVKLALDSQRIERLELRTPWQTLQLPGDAVVYDAGAKVFRIVGRGASAGIQGGESSDAS